MFLVSGRGPFAYDMGVVGRIGLPTVRMEFWRGPKPRSAGRWKPGV
jgi:hypothetical protein